MPNKPKYAHGIWPARSSPIAIVSRQSPHPLRMFPDELRPVAQAVVDLHSRGVAVDSTSLYLELTSAKVDAPGSLLAGLGTYAQRATPT